MLQEVTVAWERQRLLLFIVYLDDQGNDLHDQDPKLKQIRICDHVHHPLRWSGGGNKKKFSLLPKEGPRLPPLAALGWIIA